MYKCDVIYVKEFDSEGEEVFEVVGKFNAETREDCAKFIENYNKEHTDRTYYYRQSPAGRFGIVHEDRIVTYSDTICGLSDVDEHIYSKIAKLRIRYRKLKKQMEDPEFALKVGPAVFSQVNEEIKSVIRKIGKLRRLSRCKVYRKVIGTNIAIKDWCVWYLWDKWKGIYLDVRWFFIRVWTYMRTKHDPSEMWGLDEHMLDDLRYNLNRLITDGQTIPPDMIDQAVVQLHGKEEGFTLEGWWKKHNTTADVDELAVQIRDKEWKRIIADIDCYHYYTHEIDSQDKNYNPDEMKDIYFPGTYKELDYQKMNDKANEYWKRIWEAFIKYGQSMWD